MNPEEELSNKWDIHRVIQEAVRTAHFQPSIETRERLIALETNQKTIIERLDKIDFHLGEQDKILNKSELEIKLQMLEQLKLERELSNSYYAPIIIKTIVYSFIALICIAFIGFLTRLIW